jgi:hypothetical protein
MREYLFLHYEQKPVAQVMLDNALELSLSLLFNALLEVALRVVDQVNYVVSDVNWGVDV